MRLSFAPQDNNGLKTVSLARIGSYEVWLSEFAQGHSDCDAQFWVELYDLKSDEFSFVFLRRLRFGDGRRPIAL
jgi:hypothetical protein